MQEIEFEIDREAVKRYFFAILLFVSLGSCYFPLLLGILPAIPDMLHRPTVFLTLVLMLIGIPSVVFAFVFAFGRWLCPKKANNLRYRLEGDILRVDGGVFFLFRKSIPLERITDVALVQGPVLRYFNIWAMRIQTAGSPQAEATLYGVLEPEKIRELILARRKGIKGEKTEDA